nr:amidohydrolase [Croceivirga thetidis]
MEELNVALIQSHLLWENPQANRLMFAEKIQNLPESVDLIVLPEMFTTGFTMQPTNIDDTECEKTLDWMQDLAKTNQVALTGSIVFKEKEYYYNRLFFVHPEGQYKVYNKRHTFSLAGEHKVYEPGLNKLLVDFKGFKICPLICYDLRFPVWARNAEDYDILLYVANWPKPRISAWDALLKARAIENMAYCIGVNRVGLDGTGHQYPGHSAVYNVLGEQKVYSEKESILTTTLSKSHIADCRNKLKFLEDRDEFNLL